MFGEPSDIPGECNARLSIADNYGDNDATIRCQLPVNHEGVHREQWQRDGKNTITITWEVDERERCDHGCDRWRHECRELEERECPLRSFDHEFSDCAFCHPGEEPIACDACGKLTFYLKGHLRECAKAPFTCKVCGESGEGNHDWPSGCPKQHEMTLGKGTAYEYVDDGTTA